MMSFTIENIAGIRSGSAVVEPGLNIVQASNFQGKSSFMSSIQAAMGSTGHYTPHPLTEGEDSGTVTVQVEDESYSVNITREHNNTVRSGNPYLSDETDQLCARLFAFLGEDNPIRTAVRNGADLTAYLQAPLDIEDIDAQIRALKGELETVETQISDAQEAAAELPSVQKEVTQLENELAELREHRNELQNETVESTQREDTLSDELSSVRSNLQTVTNTISQLENQIERKHNQVEDKQSTLDELDVPSEIAESVDVEEKQQRITELDTHIQLIEDLYHANRNILEDGDLDLMTDVSRTVSGDEITCWLCDEKSMKAEMEANIEQLQDTVNKLRTEKTALTDEIAEFEETKREIKQKREQQERLEQEIKQLNAAIQDRKSELQNSISKKEELEQKVSTLVDKIAETESQHNEELTDVKTEIRTKESELEQKRTTLQQLDEQKADLEQFRERKSEYRADIESLRNRKINTQYELKDEFDTAMTEIIDRFAPGFDHAHFDIKTDVQGEIEGFELNIARGGQTTTVDALSEGEVELIGVAVALAGYRVYDVDDRVPIILIDGISQLASQHLRSLTEYLEDTSEILVTTAYPEAGEFDATIISPTDWDVVSDNKQAAT